VAARNGVGGAQGRQSIPRGKLEAEPVETGIDRWREDDSDSPFEAYARAGKPDKLAAQAAQEIEAGETQPLDDFLRQA
jgi:hypothetical protein